jgi:predicted Zn-dependent protease
LLASDRFNPKQASIYLSLGNALCKQEQWTEAVDYLQKYAQLESNDWEAYYYLAEALCGQKRWHKAAFLSNRIKNSSKFSRCLF